MFEPKPIATADVTLPESIQELLERLAENAHDVWAQQRLAEGWTYGPVRDEKTRQHPCLVPYASLPEFEKEYDRRLAAETLKAILALGYRIDKA